VGAVVLTAHYTPSPFPSPRAHRDKVAETGRIDCRVCGESYQCRISYLSDPVDVYCEVSAEAGRPGPR
jgi:transcription elongation factor Elf1